jgi:hypothetical protein
MLAPVVNNLNHAALPDIRNLKTVSPNDATTEEASQSWPKSMHTRRLDGR